MANIQIFTSPEFGDIRTVDQNGEPWFVGKDVAAALGYSNPRKALIDHVDEQDKGVTKCDTLGGSQEVTVINESGPFCGPYGQSEEAVKAKMCGQFLTDLNKLLEEDDKEDTTHE